MQTLLKFEQSPCHLSSSLLKFEQSPCQLSSSVTCRKHTHSHLVQLCDWAAAEEKPYTRPPPAVIDLHSLCKLYHMPQSTISLCALTFFTFSVFLFIVSAIDYSLLGLVGANIGRGVVKVKKTCDSGAPLPTIALCGLGTLYKRGTKAMSELIVAHLSEETSPDQFRLFMRTLHRSGAMATADLVVLFPSSPPESYVRIIHEENRFFWQQVLDRFAAELELFPVKNNRSSSRRGFSAFNLGAYRKAAEESEKAPRSLWGPSQKRGVLPASGIALPAGETDRGVVPAAAMVALGSIVGFEAAELNPEDALRGFIDGAGMQMRRWACYEMLLGKVRHRFRHVLAVGVQATLVLGDPLAAARKRKAPYLLLASHQEGRRPSPDLEEKKRRVAASSAAFAGSMKRMRELSTAMSVEIVGMALQRHTRAAFHDSAALSRLTHATQQDEELLSHQPFMLSLPANGQPRRNSRSYPIVHSRSAATFRRFSAAVWLDICSDAAAYPDCEANSPPSVPNPFTSKSFN